MEELREVSVAMCDDKLRIPPIEKNGFINRDYIKFIVLESMGLDTELDLTRRTRRKEYVEARRIVAYLVNSLCVGRISSLVGIADWFKIYNKNGYPDHTTIISYLKKVDDYYFTDIQFRDFIDTISNHINFNQRLSFKKEYHRIIRLKPIIEKPKKDSIPLRILKFMREQDRLLTVNTIHTHIGGSHSSVTRALWYLNDKGKIVRESFGCYRLPKSTA